MRIRIDSRPTPPSDYPPNTVFHVTTSEYVPDLADVMREVRTAHWHKPAKAWRLYSPRNASVLLSNLVWAGMRNIEVTGPWAEECDTVRYYRHPSEQWLMYNPDGMAPLFVAEPEPGLDGRPSWSEAEMQAVLPHPGWWEPPHFRAPKRLPLHRMIEAAYTGRADQWSPCLEKKVGESLTAGQAACLFQTIAYEATAVRMAQGRGEMGRTDAEMEIVRLMRRMNDLMTSIEDKQLKCDLRSTPVMVGFRRVCDLTRLPH